MGLRRVKQSKARERPSRFFREKIITDPVHGEIGLSALEIELINGGSFQRLRRIKQLGLAPLVYPSANHSRFSHSLGVFHIMGRIFDLLIDAGQVRESDRVKLRVAALLHDIGHYPYSHVLEYIEREHVRAGWLVRDSKKQKPAQGSRKASPYPSHERLGQLIITTRQDIVNPLRENGIDPEEISSMIAGEHNEPLLNELIHSSLDADRLDYLVRDSIHTGVPYGRIDIDYLLNNLTVTDDGHLAVRPNASTAAEHLLIARYFMSKVVYLHKTVFGFEALLRRILSLMRKAGLLYKDGEEIKRLVSSPKFVNFHDGYIDSLARKIHEM